MVYQLPKVPRDAFVIIRADGSEETHPFPAQKGAVRLDALKATLGFKTLDFVTLTKRGRAAHIIMVVNDLGYETTAIEHGPGVVELVPVQARYPVNAKATELYQAVGGRIEIVGPVALMYDDD